MSGERAHSAPVDSEEQVFAEGISADGSAGPLSWQPDGQGGVTWLRVTTTDGHTHMGGYGDSSVSADAEVSIYTGSADDVPNGVITRVRAGTTGLAVTTSDDHTQTLGLVAHAAHEGALVAALVYPRGTHIRSVRVERPSGGYDVPMTRPQV